MRYLVFFFVFYSSLLAQSKEVDLSYFYSCSTYYCPEGHVDKVSPDGVVESYSRAAIVVNRRPVGRVYPRKVIVSTNTRPRLAPPINQPTALPTSTNTQVVVAQPSLAYQGGDYDFGGSRDFDPNAPLQVDSDPYAISGLPQDNYQAYSAFQPQEEIPPGGTQVAAASVPGAIPGVEGATTNRFGNIPIADDEPETTKPTSPAGQTQSEGSRRSQKTATTPTAGQLAVAQNRNTSNERGRNQRQPTATPTRGGGFGNFEAGTPQAAAAPVKARSITDPLKSIASNLNKKFMALFGLKGKKKPKDLKLAAYKGSRSGKKAVRGGKQSNEKLLTPEQILNQQLRNYASDESMQLQLGSKKTYFFSAMCGHYDMYAKSNRIPSYLSHCPGPQ